MTIRLSTALLVLALLTIGFIAVPQVHEARAAHERADQRSAALLVAKAEVTELTTLSPTTLDDSLKSLNRRLTPSFSRQFQAMYATFASVVSDKLVTSRGSIQSAGLVSSTDRRAVVLVAARARVSSPDSKQGLNRSYRFEISLTRQGSRWLISAMRFVS